MPELPEVEIYARYFTRHALGQPIRRVTIRDERILGVRPPALRRALLGRRFAAVRRHGKHLFADAGAMWLHLHFGMTGDLAYYRDGDAAPRFAKVIFSFDGAAHLAFEDARLFGVVDLTSSPERFMAERGLGPDPLDARFDLRTFRTLLRGRRGAIKSLLLSQDVIAGIGNLYADEALYRAAIHPRTAVDALSDEEIRNLFAAIRRELRDAIARHESDAPDPPRLLLPNRTAGAGCPRCGGTIERTVVFGRTTFFCTRHQRPRS